MAAVGQSQGLLPSEIAQGEKRAEKHRENLAVLAGKIGDHVCARLTTTLSLVEEGRKAGKRMAASRPLQEVEVEDVMRLASSLSHVGALKEDFFEKAAAVVKAKAKQGIRIRAPLEEESLGHDQTDICMEVSAHDRSGFTVPSAARVEREKGRGRRKRETRGRGRGMMGEEPRVLRHLRGGLSVIYKPPGWTVETSSESFLKQLSKEREEEGWRFSSLGEWLQRGGLGKESSIVSQPTVSHGATHRLDLMTSGPLLVARSMPAWLHGRLLHDSRRISKEYVCLVRGAVPQGPHVETSRLSTERDANSTSPHARVTTVGSPKGVYAETVYTPVAYLTRRESKGEKDVKKTKEKETRGGGLQREIFSLVRVKINTGRTHQIRAHMSHLGFPLLGDRKYLFSLEDAEDEKARHAGLGDESRLFLHCRELTVMRGSLTETEKGGGEEGKSVVRVESALPDDLRKVLKEFKVARRDDKQSRSGLEEVLGFGVGSSTVEYDEEEEEEEEETGENRVQVEEIGSEDVRKEEEVGGLKKSEEEDGEESAEKGEGDETHEVVREDPTKREKGGTSIEKGLSAEEEGEEDAFEYIRSLSLPSLEDEVNSAAVRWPLRQKLRERADRRRAVKREQREKQKKEMTLRQTFEEREALLLPASLRARTQLGEAADGVESQSLPSSSSSKSTELLVPGIFAASPVGSSAEGSQGQEDSARARKTESAFEALQTFLGVENGDEAEEEEGEEGELESLEKGGEEIEKWEFGGDEEDGMTVEDEDEREGVEGGEGGEEEKEEEEEEEIVSLDPQKVLGGLKRLAAIADSSSLSPSSSSPPLLSVTLPSQEIDDSADSLSQTQQEEEEAEENQNSSEHPLDDSVPVPPRRRKEEEDEAIAREEIDRRASLLSVEEEPLQTVGGMEAEEGGGTPEAEGALSTKRIPSPSLLRFRRSAVASRSLQRGKGKGRKKASILKEVETSR
uniref:Pseudouridine synthase RsuA/RluA-like domain-containing protein n=1 Tax=Chromera velia CCMP2878 TaxID=1169474 RepID=A0A0G4HRA7_9ALVE|eukprot:Cvel_8070.t1-p1 / transcript=Cvel_8070.t1 / gene=Cvel_8070 / organism=Chromera_velia_CCMP2878 / gene_product=RNA pseudouridine synthase 2, chloroplastic, putative / transcript_product=RNA pseudouridine synthase 2, chloroplastic, putative / location=Cvel_scaffold437:74571-79153(+) / protein_length=963 / sequence_SO=supercontig / SO=protein_coding / is_pseudo=false